MTILNLNMWNHVGGGHSSYADMIRFLRAQVADAGHTLVEDDRFLEPPVVNVVMEGFDACTLRDVCVARQEGKIVVCLVTEMPTSPTRVGTFLWNNLVDYYWSERVHHFILAAPWFNALWCLVDSAADFLVRLNQAAVLVNLGYSPRLVAIDDREPDHDFVFYGTRTPRREAVVATFRRCDYSVLTIWDMPPLWRREEVVGRARVVLDVKHFDWWPLVSTSRVASAILRGRPCVSEARGPGATQARWEQVSAFAPDGLESFVRAADYVRSEWQTWAREQLDALKGIDFDLTPAIKLAENTASRRPPDIAVPEIRECPVPPPPSGRSDPDVPAEPPRLVATINSVNFVQWRGRVYSVPQGLGPIDVSTQSHPSIRAFASFSEARRFAG